MRSFLAAVFVSLLFVQAGCAAESDTAAASNPVQAQPQDAKPAAAGFAALGLPDPELSIGSPAPALDIEHWVSNANGTFQPVTKFAKDKIYVVEFWATWCGPCVASMPHLAELQGKLKDQVQLVSVSDEDLETVQAFLGKPYPDGGEEGPKTYGELTSAYCLTADPDGSTGKDYMRAALQNGIPCCFLVGKTGVIEWIGHPMRLDEPLSQVMEGTWDRDAFAEEFKASQVFDMAMQQIFMAARANQMDKAFAMIDTLKKLANDPRQKMQVQGIETQLKLQPIAKKVQAGDIDGAIADLEVLIEETEDPIKQQLTRILGQIKEQAAAAKEAEEEAKEEK